MPVHHSPSPPLPPLRWLLIAPQRSRRSSSHSSEAGLSLIECLVAMIIIAITAVAITPPIFLATATRIQSRRAEQANQIAQAEVDRIRGIVERGRYTDVDLPPSTGAATGVETYAAATSVDTNTTLSPANCGTNYPKAKPTSPTTLVRVDIDGDCTAEYAMQVFRTSGCVPQGQPANRPYSFRMGVRVYAYNPNEGAAASNLQIERANLGLTEGRRDQGSVRRPLQVLYSKAAINSNERALPCVANDASPPAAPPTPPTP